MNAERRVEIECLVRQMNDEQLHVIAYLVRLYHARKAAPSVSDCLAICHEIERVQEAIRDGSIPSVPSLH
jgi:hypothetical protein